METIKHHSSSGKDIESSFLSHNQQKTPATEFELYLANELEKKNKEFNTLRSIHNSMSIELIETNRAVMLLARKYEKISQDKEIEIANLIEQQILPCCLSIKEFINSKEALEIELEVLIAQMKAIITKLNHGTTDILNQLTVAEKRVAVMIRKGANSQQIANMLCISENTVKTHRKNIRNKLNLQNKKMTLVEHLGNFF